MVKIGICDDEAIVLKNLQGIISESLKNMQMEGEISLFQTGKKLLEEERPLDILFLDIVMPQLNGFEVGKKLREQGNPCKIIMETRCDWRYKEAFYINAFRFVTKPFEPEEVRKALEDAVYAIGGEKRIEVYKERRKYNICQRDIFYIEAIDSSVEFTLEEGIFRKESSLEALEKILNEKLFYRISRQCIVNMAQIDKYEKGTITINNQQKIVSQRRKKAFDIKYNSYKAAFAEQVSVIL